MLVDGIAVTSSAYEDTKKILHDHYGDKNRIIQAHLDYLEEVTPIRLASAEALNTTYIEWNRRIQDPTPLGIGGGCKGIWNGIGPEDSLHISRRRLPTLDHPGETRMLF